MPSADSTGMRLAFPAARLETCLSRNLTERSADVMALDKETKNSLIEEFKRHQGDTGSPEVQIALLSSRITQLTDHLRTNKHDESSRRGLLKLVGQRRRLLAYIRRNDFNRYMALTDRLSIRRK